MRGKHRSPLYNTWYSMIRRCEHPDDPSYRHYGARGITVCQRWRDSLDAFALDMGARPPGHTLDRIDNDGNYEPGNCRWADRFVRGSPRQQRENLLQHPTMRGCSLTIRVATPLLDLLKREATVARRPVSDVARGVLINWVLNRVRRNHQQAKEA